MTPKTELLFTSGQVSAAAAAIANARAGRRGCPPIENVLELLQSVKPSLHFEVMEDALAALMAAIPKPEFDWELCLDGHEILRGTDYIIHLERGSHYRGQFQAKLEITNPAPMAFNLSEADGWSQPRYYFDGIRAKLELEAWMKARMQL